jgi:hypothetical protein
VIIQGVPCPNIDRTNILEEDFSALINLIKDFNIALQIKSKEIGFRFLDVHTLTNRGDGISNLNWHLDSHHLTPEGIFQAWDTFLL